MDVAMGFALAAWLVGGLISVRREAKRVEQARCRAATLRALRPKTNQ